MKFEDIKVGMVLHHKGEWDQKTDHVVLQVDNRFRRIFIGYTSHWTDTYKEAWEEEKCLGPYYEKESSLPKFKVGDILNHVNQGQRVVDYEIRGIVDNRYVIRWEDTCGKFDYGSIDEISAKEYHFLKPPVEIQIGQVWKSNINDCTLEVFGLSTVKGVDYIIFLISGHEKAALNTEEFVRQNFTLTK